MIISRRMARMGWKWLRTADSAGRKRIASRTQPGATAALGSVAGVSASRPVMIRKGHFAAYSNDGQRFEVPLAFLKSDAFGELLRMSEDMFGLPRAAAPITLPCDAAFLGSVLSSLRRRSPGDAERELLPSVAALSCSATLASRPVSDNNLLRRQVCSR